MGSRRTGTTQAGAAAAGNCSDRERRSDDGLVLSIHLVLGLPARERRAQRRDRRQPDAGGEPDRHGAVGEDGGQRDVGTDAERDEHADDATAHGARDRHRVAGLADEVRQRDHGDRGRCAERVEHRPQDAGVEDPPGERPEDARIGPAQHDEAVPHAAADEPPAREQGADAAGAQGVGLAAGAVAEHEARDDRQRGQRARHGGDRDGPARADDTGGQQPARDGDRAEEDAVEHHEEGEEGACGLLRREARALQRPQRQGRPADAGGGQQARDAGAAERDLRARAEVHPRGDAAGDEPQEQDVAGEGGELEADRRDDPARIRVERAARVRPRTSAADRRR